MKTNQKARRDETKCPYCGGEIFIVHSSKIYGDGHDYGAMQVCENWPQKCDAYAGAGATMANKELRELRKQCHARFDCIWQSRERSRNAAYNWLCRAMKKPRHLAHIALFKKDECEKLLKKLTELGY